MRRTSARRKSTETILSISPKLEDHNTVKNIFRQYSTGAETAWKVVSCSTLEWATNLLRRNEIPLAICERDLQSGSWRDVLQATAQMPHSPLLVVTSRFADERLWAEVLNEGGWDVLAKPFDFKELTRVIESAVRHWHEHCAGTEAMLPVKS